MSSAKAPEFYHPPRGSADRPAIRADRRAMSAAELLSRPLAMALIAERPAVGILIRTTEGKRHDVVNHSCRFDLASLLAVLTTP